MEFHAVILCGPGKQLAPFSKERQTGVPKALLPLAHRPMLEYVLDWCGKAFFPKVTVLCHEDSFEEIDAAVAKYRTSRTEGEAADGEFVNSIEVEEFSMPTSGEVFPYLLKRNAAHENFVLLPCDFITDLPPQVLIEAYRSRLESDLGMLVCYRNQLDIEDKKNKIFPKNYTVYADLPTGQSQLLDYYSAQDIEFHKALKIKTQLVWNYPMSTVSSKLLSSAVFFGNAKLISAVFTEYKEKFDEAYFASRPLIKVIRDLARKPWQSPSCAYTVALLEVPQRAVFIRSNNLPVYMEANRHYLKIQAREGAGKSSGPKDKLAANVGADLMVGEGTELGEKTNVKRTVVGANCTIGKRVKLTGSVILDNTTIEDDVQLENSIVGHNVIIRSKSKLINCYVESTHEVAKGTQSKGDTLLCLTLEGLVEQAVESSSSEEEDTDDSYEDYDDEYGDNSDGLFAY